ncbi:MAG TPA: hypothetical protein DCY12_00865 [Candidatus Atribacteria bacterium]|nr:hypothetical protein [Candidatus Atribacteria bacterium]
MEYEPKFQTVVESANDSIFIMEQGLFIDCNTKTVEIFGLSEAENIIGKAPYEFSPERQPDGRLSKEKALEFIHAAEQGKPQFFDWKHMKLDGTVIDTEVSLNQLPPPHETSLIAIVRDVTERKRVKEDLRHLNERLVEEHRQRKLLSKRLIQALETRNREVSMDLHDHIGQTLVTLKIDLDMISGLIGKTDTNVRAWIEKAKNKTIQAIEDVEKIASGLRPSMIDTLGLVPSLRELFNEIKQQGNIEIHFFTRDVPQRFDPEKELAIFRVVQEALCNVVKHSGAKNCFVNLFRKGNSLTLTVEDDGCGLDEAKKKVCASKGRVPLGLLFMQERVVQLNGEFSVESRRQEGVHLLVELPL